MDDEGEDMKVTYINCYDEFGSYLDMTKRLDEEINVGYLIQRYREEGYVNWEIINIMERIDEDVEISTGIVKRSIIHVKVKQHPYVKTHCKHEWENSRGITLENTVAPFYRECTKCKQKEKYNWGTCKWDLCADLNKGVWA